MLLSLHCNTPPLPSGNGSGQQFSAEQMPRVKIHKVSTKHFLRSGTYTGTISPSHEVKLICYGGGRVEALRNGEGVFVKAGTSLAAIDSATAFLLLKTARMQEKILFKTVEQTRKHQKEGNASALAVDQSELAYLQAKKSRIEAEKQYSGALCVTPISGTITQRNIQLFQEVPQGTHTFTIGQTGTMKITLAIDEADIVFVKSGDTAKITTPLYPGKVWKGTVKSIAREATTDNRTFTTEILVVNTDNLLRPGASAEVSLFLEKIDNAMVIPDTLIQLSSLKKASVMVVSAENRVIYREIAVCCRNEKLLLVQAGLSSGEKIIIAQPGSIPAGTRVDIIP